MKFNRSGGILLHPSSLCGPYGIGDLGPEAHRWINFLEQSGCGLWQVLPLGPTGYADSPYQCFSAFAGNPYLISLDFLIEEKLLEPEDCLDRPDFPETGVDYGSVIPWKMRLLRLAYSHFSHLKRHAFLEKIQAFREQQAYWLPDFCLFMAIKETYGGGSWVNWPEALRIRENSALALFKEAHREAIDQQEFFQFLFFHQWKLLRQSAHEKGILIIGDIPIFVAHDSSEVWAHPELFFLRSDGNPRVVAGVPPDYFSKTGQLWGNPLYHWKVHKEDNYQWWLKRLEAVFELVDVVRLDHFRGFAGYWEVKYGAKTAEKGRWAKGPGISFFKIVKQKFGELPIIAEDLGVITPDVVLIRDSYNLPGMKILQFGFEGNPKDPFLPHNYIDNCVVYTGTHDNDTSVGWYQRITDKERDFYRRYLGSNGDDVAWDLIRAAWSSVAVFAIAPMQDFLSLGNEARMNYPGNPSGNWTWRLQPADMDTRLAKRIQEINFLYDRLAQD